MYPESDLLMLSGLQHVLFCERQWALIHIEQQWAENRLTAQGNLLHEKVHSAKTEQRGSLRTVRTLRLVSYKLGLVGQSDLVEFHRCDDGGPGVKLKGAAGLWRPFPVEYKRGKPKKDKSDEVQLCAQAMCLEEMLDVAIPEGAVFYGRNKRRRAVVFDDDLRRLTTDTAQKVHALFDAKITPAANLDARCKACSLLDVCLPDKAAPGKTSSYLQKMIRSTLCEKC